jgi:N-acetylmuramoyl-L-alanine amidase
MFRVYISASTQKENKGVSNYGTEQDRMMQFADRVKYWLGTQKQFTVFRNQPGWSLEQTVNDCNNLSCDLFIDNHTNAGGPEAQGTEAFYYGQGGEATKSYTIAKLLYDRIAPLSVGTDRWVKPDTSLYDSGLYVVQATNPPACLIELIFHTNLAETNHFIFTLDDFAKAEAKAVCDFFELVWIEPVKDVKKMTAEEMFEKKTEKAEEWKKGFAALDAMLSSKSDFGDLNILRHWRSLLEKINN